MRKIVEEVEGEGLESLLGKRVLLLCAGYFYHGYLVGVNGHDVMLKDAGIVYETGEWAAEKFADRQAFPASHLYVRTAAIEAYGEVDHD